MAEYIEKKKALGIYVLKAFVVDDQRLEVSYMSLKPSKERRFSDIIPSITQKLLKKHQANGIYNGHNTCLGSVQNSETFLYTTSMILLRKLKNQTKWDLRRS